MVCEDCGVARCVRCWRAFHAREMFKIEDYCKVVSENNWVTVKVVGLYLYYSSYYIQWTLHTYV